MSEDNVENGEVTDPNIDVESSENEPAPVDPYAERFDTLASQLSQVADGLTYMQSQLGEFSKAIPKQEQKDDLNEMLRQNPALAFKKMFEENNATLKNQLKGEFSKESFDREVHEKYPVNDPKFKDALNKNWKKMVSGGLDPYHPKALMTVAEVTALEMGKGKSVTANMDVTGESTASKPITKPRGSVSDNDNRVRVYMMTNPSKEKLDRFKQKLAASDKQKSGGR